MIPATQKDNKSELYAHFTAPNCLSFLLVVKGHELPTLSLLLDLATPKNYKASFLRLLVSKGHDFGHPSNSHKGKESVFPWRSCTSSGATMDETPRNPITLKPQI
jgi:hypothetical protein